MSSSSEMEKKWQDRWQEAGIFKVDFEKAEKPYFTHVMFPYPSGDRLHVGHWYNYAPADSYARYKKMQGYDVYSPMGFDAFGLPAENYAIKTGVHPDESTQNNVDNMTKQLKAMGCMYDWDHGVNTSKPPYYHWTQWLFLQMYKHDLAYKKKQNANWCGSCQTVLANEQVVEGECERCGDKVIQKPIDQWFWRTKKYADELLQDADKLDWPNKTKIMQENWIGKSQGVLLKQKVKDLGFEVDSYDSVPQTFMAQTYVIIAPEHPLVPKMVEGTEYEEKVMAFVEEVKEKKASKKFNIDEDMEGIFTGRYIDNPFGTGDLPIWISSFVVMDYGTGMVNCSAHDYRDFDFAKKYDIPLRPVMFPEDPVEAEKIKNLEYCYAKAEEGVMHYPEEFKGRKWGEVREDLIDYLVEKGMAERSTQYRLRDWCISRQRYWGAPIPIVYDPEGNEHPVPEEHLPWVLPTDVEFKPEGHSPLADSKELVERTEKIFGEGWRPEVDTMDTFVCSSFYSYRFLAYNDEKNFVNKEREKKWMPVQAYIGGSEHACLHLIYARFVTKALADMGYVSHREPFQKLVHQGIITHDGAKMSKSKGNVVSPDSFVERYGSDVFRMYLMFMGPFIHGGDWSDTGIKGTDRFAKKLFNVATERAADGHEDDLAVLKELHKSIKKVGEDIEKMHFNTALASLMETMNVIYKQEKVSSETIRIFATLLAPMAPHIAEEIWEGAGGKGFVIEQSWPEYDPMYLQSSTVTIAVQINGKLRGTFEFSNGVTKEEVVEVVYEHENIKKWTDGKTIAKEIFIPNKILNVVVK